MSLEQKLAELREASAKKMPAEARSVVMQARQDLEASGIVGRALKAGIAAPEFSLADSAGDIFSLSDLRRHGPVVLTFFRGNW